MRNYERGRKPCSKRSPGLSGIEKRRKITKCWSIGLIAVRGGGLEGSPRYAMLGKYLRFLRISSRYAKPFWASGRGTRRMWRWNDLIFFIRLHAEVIFFIILDPSRSNTNIRRTFHHRSIIWSCQSPQIVPEIVFSSPDCDNPTFSD